MYSLYTRIWTHLVSFNVGINRKRQRKTINHVLQPGAETSCTAVLPNKTFIGSWDLWDSFHNSSVRIFSALFVFDLLYWQGSHRTPKNGES